MKRFSSFVSLVVVSCSLASCATQPGTILERFSLAGGNSITTDARQRVVTANALRSTSRPGLVNPEQITCAEPSPDVAIALANTFGAGISVFGYGSGSVTGAQAEGIAQLAERTVAVQLLRDQMYRACEAFSNGAISGTTYTLIMSKNNNAMITLLLGETAGGAFGRSLAGIGAAGSAQANASLTGLLAAGNATKQAIDDLNTAELKVQAAQNTLTEKQNTATADDAKTNPPATDSQKSADKQAVQDAQNQLAAAKATRDELAARLKNSAETTAKSAAEIKTLIAAGGITNSASPELANVLKGIQQQFLNTDFSEQFVAACLVELGLDPVVSPTEEEFFGKLRTRVNNAMIAVANDPKDVHLQRIARDALSTYENTTIRFHKSRLSDYCASELTPFITAAHADEINLKKMAIQLQNLKTEAEGAAARAKTLAAFEKALSACKEVTDPTQKTQCIAALTKLINP